MARKQQQAPAERKRGTITKKGRNGVWLVRVYVGTKLVEGKMARKYVGKVIHGTYRQADQERTKMLGDLDTGSFVAPSKIALDEYLDNWLKTSASLRVSVRTLAAYRDMMERYVGPELGHFKLDKVSPGHIQSLYASMTSRGLGPRIVRYTHTVLKSALKQAVLFRQLPFNPAEGLSIPEMVKKDSRTLTAAQVARILAETKEDHHHALWALLLNTGMRPQEVLALKWDDLADGKVSIVRALVQVGYGRWEIGPPKTKASRRIVSVPQAALGPLAEHRALQAAHILRMGSYYKRNGFMFATREGKTVSPHNVYRAWKATLDRLDIPYCTLYSCRHTHASLLLAAGWPVKAVSERLGHASAKMTLDVYCHTLPETDSETAAAFDRLLQQAAGS